MPFRFLGRILWSQKGALLWLVALAAIVCAWAFLNRGAIATYFENRSKRDEVRAEVEEKEVEVRRSEQEWEVLSKGGFETEKVARETYHMSKPGEKVLRLYPSPLDEDLPTTKGQLKTDN